jgi:chromate reductase, NAD(P)H dehydrogenase (quinone)
MSTHKIGYFVGSLSSTSINRTLSKALIRLAPPELEFTEIPIRDLPLYSQDYDAAYPREAQALKDAVAAADGILFISPEYNRSIPGALKNAIDWASRPWGTNSFARKPTGIIGASPGGIGTAVMQASFRSVLSFLDAPQLNAPEAYIRFVPEIYGDDGEVSDPSTADFLRHYMEEYAAFVQRVLDVSASGHIGDENPVGPKPSQ